MKTTTGILLINQHTKKQHGCPDVSGNHAHRNGAKDGASLIAVEIKQPAKLAGGYSKYPLLNTDSPREAGAAVSIRSKHNGQSPRS
ncbi:MAG: hypothetical protein ABL933_11765 [Methyloglobulus sp.]|nr:hypothetical protein [Methyloglobulus sp.]